MLKLPESYREQDCCCNCAKCFEERWSYEYAVYYCMSDGEMPVKLHPHTTDRGKQKRKWNQRKIWKEGRRVAYYGIGICDNYERGEPKT